jgi:phage terminase large subunit GpA-like protein
MHKAWPEVLGEFARVFEEPEHLPCSEWNERHRYLPNGQPFRAWPWQAEILDCVDEPEVNEVILEMASQTVGKSEVLLGILTYKIATMPADYLVVLPNLNQAERWSRTRWLNTVKQTPILQQLLPGEGARTLAASGSKLLFKRFENSASLSICGANSAATLAAASIRGLFFDETDLAQAELLGIGSPFANAARRLTSFADSFLVEASSPTIAGESRIDEDYQRSDRRQWLVPCPACGHRFELRWEVVYWEKTSTRAHRPETACIKCPACSQTHQDTVRRLMVLNGAWVPENPVEKRVRGYRMSAINVLQPTRKGFASRLHEMAVEWLEAQGNPLKLQPFLNQVAGESWVKEEVKAMPAESLLERRENYFHSDELPDPARSVLPERILLLTAAIDVQVNRLESLICGWTRGRSCYVIDHRQWPCNPAQPDGWNVVGEYLAQTWTTTWANGKRLGPHITLVDSGYLAPMVQQFCAQGHYRFPTRGVGSAALPLIQPMADKRFKAQEIHTDVGKSLFYNRLAIQERDSDGYIHLHMGLGREFCEQLLAEVTVRDKRTGRLVFRLQRERSNEALDLMILCLAGEVSLRAPYDKLECERLGVEKLPVSNDTGKLEPKAEAMSNDTPPPPPPPRRRRVIRPGFWGPGGIRGL